MSHLRVGSLLLTGSLVFSSGCATKRITADFEAQSHEKVELVHPVRSAQEAGDGPFQLALQLHPSVLERTIAAMLPDDLLAGERITATVPGQPAPKLPNPPPNLPVNGPFAAFIKDRLAQVQKQGPAAASSMAVTPSLKPGPVTVRVSPRCDGCLSINLDLTGAVTGAAVNNMALGGKIALLAKVSSDKASSSPMLKIDLEEVEQVAVDVPAQLPPPFGSVKERLETLARDRMTAILQSETAGKQKIALKDKMKLGQGIQVEGLDVHTSPDGEGTLFLGFNTNLNAPGSVAFDDSLPERSGEWSFLMGDGVLSSLLLQAAQSGKIATRYNTQGKPDPEGPIAFKLKGMHLTESGFAIDSKIWYMKFPAFWRNYTLKGNFELVDGQPMPRVVDAERGEGDGSRFASKVAEKQITSMKNLKGMGKMIPLEMPLPAGKGQVMKMIPEVIRCHPGMLELGGKLEVVSKGGQREGGQREGGSREGQ